VHDAVERVRVLAHTVGQRIEILARGRVELDDRVREHADSLDGVVHSIGFAP